MFKRLKNDKAIFIRFLIIFIFSIIFLINKSLLYLLLILFFKLLFTVCHRIIFNFRIFITITIIWHCLIAVILLLITVRVFFLFLLINDYIRLVLNMLLDKIWWILNLIRIGLWDRMIIIAMLKLKRALGLKRTHNLGILFFNFSIFLYFFHAFFQISIYKFSDIRFIQMNEKAIWVFIAGVSKFAGLAKIVFPHWMI